ncbi:MAG: hypothetical protein KIT72_10545 [Polyangiaceae bacterium]|nr:hypothetical protein [Polyangiaceae bacterium]MCW5790851.1 hypothetical protein [Polyangiaceae bacterium]
MTRDPQDDDDELDERVFSERDRRRLERLVPMIIKRLVETGYEKVTEKVSEGYGRISDGNVRQLVSELKLPKEALQLILSQIDETKNGLYRVTAKEIRDFLEHTNFSEEIAKVLTTLSFEIKTEVRFIPNDAKAGVPKPDVKASMRVKRDSDEDPSERE